MGNLFKAVQSLAWFVSQALGGALGVSWLWIPLGFVLVICAVGVVRSSADVRPKLWLPGIGMPAIWIVEGLWAGFNWRDPASHGVAPEWLTYPPMAAIGLSLLASVTFLIFLRGGRLFVASYSLVNIYVTFIVSILSSMAVTGVWL